MSLKNSLKHSRRQFLQASLATSTLLFAKGSNAEGAVLEPRPAGRTTEETGEYGMPSKYANAKRSIRSANGLLGGARTPLAQSQGIITPSGLHFEINHGGVPDISPREHKLLIHGMVNNPKIFTMEDIMRFPSISRMYFLECAGNTEAEWFAPESPHATVQRTHGLTSCSEWTGVPLKIVLHELGVHGDGKWLLAEGDDSSRMTRSIPMWKAMDDAILAYAQNGEFLRPEQGFPLRLLVPGFEGNMNVKWLRRLEVSDRPWWTHQEVTEYADPRPNGKALVFSFYMDVKSVITSPSATMKLNGPGFYEITGLAWSGKGKIHKVEVSTDGGGRWQEAKLQTPVYSKCHTRFRMPWKWNGRQATLKSRAIDETGQVQPTYKQLYEIKSPIGLVHNNAIQSWHVAQDGEVTNVR